MLFFNFSMSKDIISFRIASYRQFFIPDVKLSIERFIMFENLNYMKILHFFISYQELL